MKMDIDINKIKDKKKKLREDLIIVVFIVMIISFPLFLIIKSMINFKLYTELLFYLSVLAIIAWYGIGCAVYLVLKNRYKQKIAYIFRITGFAIGVLFSYTLGYALGYNGLMFIVYLVLGGLLVSTIFLHEIVRILRNRYET